MKKIMFAVFWVLIIQFGTPVLNAFEIKTGFTDGCHEEMTIRVVQKLLDDRTLPQDGILPKDSATWNDVADSLLGSMGFEFSDPWRKFVFHSFVIGVRRPDDGGKSVTNIYKLRDFHGSPDIQHRHALREPKDNWAKGDVTARDKAFAFMKDQLALVGEYLDQPPEKQLKKISFYIEYYGQVTVDVWAPAYHMGIALHTVQDSFSHMIRSDDLRRIRHVMNYIEAVNYDYNLERDGLRHSFEMDDCYGGAKELAKAAETATEDFLRVFLEKQDNLINSFFEEWMLYESGCNNSNDFCNSKWVDLARKRPAHPIFENIFSCSSTPMMSQTDSTELISANASASMRLIPLWDNGLFISGILILIISLSAIVLVRRKSN